MCSDGCCVACFPLCMQMPIPLLHFSYFLSAQLLLCIHYICIHKPTSSLHFLYIHFFCSVLNLYMCSQFFPQPIIQSPNLLHSTLRVAQNRFSGKFHCLIPWFPCISLHNFCVQWPKFPLYSFSPNFHFFVFVPDEIELGFALSFFSFGTSLCFLLSCSLVPAFLL